mmetsp:Transcript_30486/g.59824  ORF Transcript_30486/g.59824 Transcript_30486/m.59824 type:complete len:206 (-) Transcript_30486:7-624(-)
MASAGQADATTMTMLWRRCVQNAVRCMYLRFCRISGCCCSSHCSCTSYAKVQESVCALPSSCLSVAFTCSAEPDTGPMLPYNFVEARFAASGACCHLLLLLLLLLFLRGARRNSWLRLFSYWRRLIEGCLCRFCDQWRGNHIRNCSANPGHVFSNKVWGRTNHSCVSITLPSSIASSDICSHGGHRLQPAESDGGFANPKRLFDR